MARILSKGCKDDKQGVAGIRLTEVSFSGRLDNTLAFRCPIYISTVVAVAVASAYGVIEQKHYTSLWPISQIIAFPLGNCA